MLQGTQGEVCSSHSQRSAGPVTAPSLPHWSGGGWGRAIFYSNFGNEKIHFNENIASCKTQRKEGSDFLLKQHKLFNFCIASFV